MKSLFDENVKEEIKHRINCLNEQSNPQWGKMNAPQMLFHCQFPLKIALKKDHPKIKPNLLAKLFFKKSLYNDKPWGKNLPTTPSLRVTEDKKFDHEKQELFALIEEFSNQRDKTLWEPHPMFGKFTSEQWGKMQYKHLDHHLTQFDV